MTPYDFDEYLKAAAATPGLTVSAVAIHYYPLAEPINRAHRLAAAYSCVVTDGAKNSHTVYICMHKDDYDTEIWTLSCGSKFLEKRDQAFTTNRDQSYGQQACANATLEMTNAAELTSLMMQKYRSHPESAPCNFWSGWRMRRDVCSHVQTFLAHLRDQVPAFKDQLSTLLAHSSAVAAV